MAAKRRRSTSGYSRKSRGRLKMSYRTVWGKNYREYRQFKQDPAAFRDDYIYCVV